MGASESKLAFKEDVFRLAREDNIPADDQWWAQVCDHAGIPALHTTAAELGECGRAAVWHVEDGGKHADRAIRCSSTSSRSPQTMSLRSGPRMICTI